MPYNNFNMQNPGMQMPGYTGGAPYQQGQGYNFNTYNGQMPGAQGYFPDPTQIPYPPIPALPMPQGQSQPSNMIFDWVQGPEAASAYYVAPGRGAMLMDINRRVFYLVSRGTNNIPLPMQTFRYYQELEPQGTNQQDQQTKPDYIQSVDYGEIDRRLKALENSVQSINAGPQAPMLPPPSNNQTTQPSETRMMQTEERR